MNKEAIRKKILDFTTTGIDLFLQKNPDLEFYAFAYDCDAAYTQVILRLNTEAGFQKSLSLYQHGKNGHRYQSEEAIHRLRYNTGDWEYSHVDSIDVLPEAEIPEDSEEEFLAIVGDCLVEFSKGETYKKIPKTKDFVAFCIGHDQGLADAFILPTRV